MMLKQNVHKLVFSEIDLTQPVYKLSFGNKHGLNQGECWLKEMPPPPLQPLFANQNRTLLNSYY